MYFEDFRIGQSFTSPRLLVAASEIVEFGRRFDPQPMHVDADAARSSMFGGLIASGFHAAALCIKLALACGVFDDGSLCGVGIDQLRWRRPLRPGTWVHLRFEVIRAQRDADGRRGRVTYAHRLRAEDELLLEMELTMLLSSRSAAPAANRESLRRRRLAHHPRHHDSGGLRHDSDLRDRTARAILLRCLTTRHAP